MFRVLAYDRATAAKSQQQEANSNQAHAVHLMSPVSGRKLTSADVAALSKQAPMQERIGGRGSDPVRRVDGRMEVGIDPPARMDRTFLLSTEHFFFFQGD